MIKKLLIFFVIIFSVTPCYASILFNGTNENLSQATGFTLGFGTTQKQLTMSAWVDLTAENLSNQKVFGKALSGNQTYNLGVQDCGLNLGSSATGTLCISLGFDNNANSSFIVASMTSSTVSGLGKHFVAIVWNNTAGTIADFTFYIDNVAQTNKSLITNVGVPYSTSFVIEDLASTLYLGSACGGTCPSEWFPGYIADACTWSKALTSGEITTLWNSGVVSPCSRIPLTVELANLIMYFPLDDLNGGNVSTHPVQLGNKAFVLDTQTSPAPTWSGDLECGSYLNDVSIKNGSI